MKKWMPEIHFVGLLALPVLTDLAREVGLLGSWTLLIAFLQALGISLLLGTVFYAGLFAFLRDRARTSFVASASVIAHFFGVGVREGLLLIAPGLGGGILRLRYVLPATAVLVVVALVVAIRWSRGRSLEKVTAMANLALGVALLFSGISTLWQVAVWRSTIAALPAPLVAPRAVPMVEKPDVYFILLDAYPSAETLESEYKIEAALSRALEQRGFSVARQSYSNYQFTLPSLAGTLNLRTVQDDRAPRSIPPLAYLIGHSEVARLLAAEGYETVAVGCFAGEWGGRSSGMSFTDLSRQRLSRSSPWGKWLNEIEWSADVRRQLDRNFAYLKEIKSRKGPKLVYAHIFTPHMPFLATTSGSFEERLRAELDRANRLLLEVVDDLLASPTPPVIILQGDHGMVPDDWNAKVGATGADPAVLRAAFGNLNALYVKGRRDLLPEGVTSVNAMRIALNEGLGYQFERVKDESFLWFYEKPAQFRDVTAVLRGK